MKIFATLALLFIGLLAIATEPNRAHTGIVREVATDRMTLDEASGTVMIGFVGDDDALSSLEKIRVGDEVRAVFGSTAGPDGRSINKLLSIRICTRNDKQCSADYENQKIEEQEYAKKRELSEKEHSLCNDSMHASLSSDSRYISNDSVPVSTDYLAKYNALTGTSRTCASSLLKAHEKSVLEACLLHHCGDNIGGGCWHIAGYSTNASAIQKAIDTCSK